MKRIAIFVVMSALVFAAGVFIVGSTNAREAVVLTATVKYFDSSGTAMMTALETTAIRPDGSSAREELRIADGPNGETQSAKSREILSVDEETRTLLVPLIASKTTWKLRPETLEHLKGYHESCSDHFAGLSQEATAQIHGLQVEYFKGVIDTTDEDCGNCSAQTEIWASAEAGCHVMKEIITSTRNGQSYVAKLKETLQVELGSRDELFVIPDTYEEKPPSEVNVTIYAREGVSLDPQEYRQADENYHASREGRPPVAVGP